MTFPPQPSGLAFYCIGLVILMFWINHIIILFWRIKFPFHAKHYESKGYFRYIHAIMIFTVVILPLECLGAILGSGGLTIPRFPPVTCFAKETDATFYAFILPTSVVMATGISLIAIILWVLVTRVGTIRRQQKVSENVTSYV